MTNDDPSKFELVINVANGEATRPPCRRRCSRPPTRAIDKACLAAIAHSRFWHEAAVRKCPLLRRLELSGGKICGDFILYNEFAPVLCAFVTRRAAASTASNAASTANNIERIQKLNRAKDLL